MSLNIGQLVDVDLFGLQVPGVGCDDTATTAMVVGLAPGAITIRVDLPGHGPTEVTVGPGRLFGPGR